MKITKDDINNLTSKPSTVLNHYEFLLNISMPALNDIIRTLDEDMDEDQRMHKALQIYYEQLLEAHGESE